MNFISIFAEILGKTPIYAWVILVVLLKRGMNASKDTVLSIKRMLIFPIIFIVWGLEKVINGFAFPGVSILIYITSAFPGIAIGYVLYKHFRQFYLKDDIVYRTGTYMPMVIMMLNFFVKYVLNVVMSIDSQVYNNLEFNLFYAIICGVLVGLSIGGIVQAARFVTSGKIG